MDHKLFGKLKHSDDRWIGKATLPAFQEAAPEASGAIPIHVHDPDEDGPSTHQEAAFQYLVGQTDKIFPAVDREVFKSFQKAYADENWRETCGLTPAKSPADLAGEYTIMWVEIFREHHKGASYLGFRLEAAWEDDSGLMVICHANKPARWTTCDGIYEDELIASDEPVGDEPSANLSPGLELGMAILNGEEAKAKKLLAAGADINALGPKEVPPRWFAVDETDPVKVRRLLDHGADPRLKNPHDNNNTPLRHAREIYRDMGFAPSKTKDKAIEAAMEMARSAFANEMQKAQTDLEEIMRILEEAERQKSAGKTKP